MVETDLGALGGVVTRWTTGGAAAPAAPEAWREAIAGSEADPELALLALSGHLLGTMAVAEPPSDLAVLPDLPALPQPTIPDTLRPLARRLLLSAPDQRGALLDLIGARGWTVHPGDWMPAPGDESAPEIYSAWSDWAALAGGGEAATAGGEHLTAESWHDFGPAGRAAALARLRRTDPASARALLESRMASEPAESRLRLAQSLSDGLGAEDVPLLETLLGDRAPKVKAVAASLLARLGRGGAEAEDAGELAGFFSIRSKGLLRRTRILEPNPLKTPAQGHRRDELMTRVDYPSFASALDLTPDELFGLWTWNADARADSAFAAMIAASAPDPVVADALEALGGSGHPRALTPLLPRLSVAQRAAAARRLLELSGGTFQAAVEIGGGRCGHPDPLRTPAGAALLAAVARDESGRNAALTAELQALGLAASREGAERAIKMLGKAGVIRSDPRLDMLRLNAALEDRE